MLLPQLLLLTYQTIQLALLCPNTGIHFIQLISQFFALCYLVG